MLGRTGDLSCNVCNMVGVTGYLEKYFKVAVLSVSRSQGQSLWHYSLVWSIEHCTNEQLLFWRWGNGRLEWFAQSHTASKQQRQDWNPGIGTVSCYFSHSPDRVVKVWWAYEVWRRVADAGIEPNVRVLSHFQLGWVSGSSVGEHATGLWFIVICGLALFFRQDGPMVLCSICV